MANHTTSPNKVPIARKGTTVKAAVTFAIAAAVLAGSALHLRQATPPRLLPEANDLAEGDMLPPEKRRAYFENFIEANAGKAGASVQDSVSAARNRVAFMEASQKRFGSARQMFLTAEREHKGSDAMDPAFGTMPDQARYQAINCLMAEGKRDQARKEYTVFLKERPLSPLVFGVHKRLVAMLRKNESRENLDQLLQAAVEKQEEYGKREMALCGPKCVLKLAEMNSIAGVSLKELEETCGTTLQGTTMSGMQKGLKSIGIDSEGMLVNREDFGTASLPFIWLDKQHYLLVHKRDGNGVVAYDPFIRSDRVITLSSQETGFSATILKLN